MMRTTSPTISRSDFRQRLLTEHAYQTPSGSAHARRQASFFPSCRYHATVLGCVWQAARKARSGTYDRKAWEDSSARILLSVEALGGRLSIDGLENLAALDRPFVIAANHMSSLETHALACMVQPFHDVTFVIKRSLLAYPMFGSILRSIDPIAVTRSNPREDLKTLLTDGARRLEAGLSLIIFPQARRQPVFQPAAFNSVACKLAARTGAPLVPLALKTDFLTRGFPLSDYGRVHPEREVCFHFGPAIEARHRERDAHQQTLDFIASRLTDWKAEVDTTPAKKGNPAA